MKGLSTVTRHFQRANLLWIKTRKQKRVLRFPNLICIFSAQLHISHILNELQLQKCKLFHHIRFFGRFSVKRLEWIGDHLFFFLAEIWARQKDAGLKNCINNGQLRLDNQSERTLRSVSLRAMRIGFFIFRYLLKNVNNVPIHHWLPSYVFFILFGLFLNIVQRSV